MAEPITSTSHTIAIHPTTPSFFVADFSTTTAPLGDTGSRTRGWTPASTVVAPGAVVAGSADGSGMSDPWVEDGVEDVDEEVHEHVAEGEDRHVTLQRDVLAPHDGVVDEEPHAVDVEDDLDDHGAADQRADVEAGDGEQREARGAQRVPPQDASGAEPLRTRHRDEVFLERGDHVAA